MLMFLMIAVGLTASAVMGRFLAKGNPLVAPGAALVLVMFGTLYATLLPAAIQHWSFTLPWVAEIATGAVTIGVGLFLGATVELLGYPRSAI